MAHTVVETSVAHVLQLKTSYLTQQVLLKLSVLYCQNFKVNFKDMLNAAILELPPLRERPDDIPLLVEHFLAVFARENARPAPAVSDAAMARLKIRYDEDCWTEVRGQPVKPRTIRQVLLAKLEK